jgi:hypothetical protein
MEIQVIEKLEEDILQSLLQEFEEEKEEDYPEFDDWAVWLKLVTLQKLSTYAKKKK